MQPLDAAPPPSAPVTSGAPASPAGDARRSGALREEAVKIIAQDDDRAGYRRGTHQLAAALSDRGLAPADNEELFGLHRLYKTEQRRLRAVVSSPGLPAPAGQAALSRPADGGAGPQKAGLLPRAGKEAGAGRRTARTAAPKVLAPVQGQAPALRVDCPMCEAKAGQICRTPGLHTPRTEPHRDRQRAEATLPDTATLQQDCPACKAPVGQRCQRPSGGPAPIHFERQDKAEAAALGKPYTSWRDSDDEDEVYEPGDLVTIADRRGIVLGPADQPPGALWVWLQHRSAARPAKLGTYSACQMERLDTFLSRLESLAKVPLDQLPPKLAQRVQELMAMLLPADERSPVPFLDLQIRWAKNKPQLLQLLVAIRQGVELALRKERDEAAQKIASAELSLQALAAAEQRAREAEAAVGLLTHQRDSARAAAESNLDRVAARAQERAEADFARDLALIEQAHQADLGRVLSQVEELHGQLDQAEAAAWEAEAQRLGAQTAARREQRALQQDLHRERARSATDVARAQDLLVRLRTQSAQLLAQKDDEIGELVNHQDLLLEEARTAHRLLEEAQGLQVRAQAAEALLQALGPPPMRALLLTHLAQRRDYLAVQEALKVALSPLHALSLQDRGATDPELSSLLVQVLRSGGFSVGALTAQYDSADTALWVRFEDGALQLLEGPALLQRARAQLQIPHRVGEASRLPLPQAPRISPRTYPCACGSPGGRVHACCTCRLSHHGHPPGQCGTSADGVWPVLILFGARKKPNGQVLAITHCRSCRKQGAPRRQGRGRLTLVGPGGEART